MSSRLSARLEHIPSAARSMLPLGTMVKIGNSRFYLTHTRGGMQLAHSEAEWNTLFQTQIAQIVGQLKNDNPGLDTDQTDRIDIDAAGRARYIPLPDPSSGAQLPPQQLKVGRTALTYIRQLGHLLSQNPGKPSSVVEDRSFKTISGSYNQSYTRLAQQCPECRRACTAIVTGFGEKALIAVHPQYRNEFLTTENIDELVVLGQLKKCQMGRPEEEMSFDELDLPKYYPTLQSCATVITAISADDPQGFYAKLLRDDLLGAVPANVSSAFGGITDARGDSYGVVIYRQGSQIQEVVYFDSHGRKPNGTPHACIKRFRTIEDAALFLANRTPYIDPSTVNARLRGSVNAITLSPFHISSDLLAFNAARAGAAEVAKARFDALFGDKDSTIVTDAIAFAVSMRHPPEEDEPSCAHGYAQIEAHPEYLKTVAISDITTYLDHWEQSTFVPQEEDSESDDDLP